MSFSLIVKHFDVIAEICPGFCPGNVSAAVNSLALQQAKKAFRRSIVMAASNGTHAANDVVIT